MFSGIVAGTGKVRELKAQADGAKKLLIEAPAGESFKDVRDGQSIAVNGCCLTVTRAQGRLLEMDVILTTLEKTNLGALRKDDSVNLERTLRLGDFLDGHLVTGHIDGTGEVKAIRQEGETRFLDVAASPEFTRGLVPQGSVSLDGISLTVSSLAEDGFTVGLIPFTWDRTNLRHRRVGDRVNLEVDLIGKYVYKYASLHSAGPSKITLNFLKEHGFINK